MEKLGAVSMMLVKIKILIVPGTSRTILNMNLLGFFYPMLQETLLREKILEAYYTKMLEPTLNTQVNFEILTPFRNGVT